MFYGNIYLRGELQGHKLCISSVLLDDVNLFHGNMPIYSSTSSVSEFFTFNIFATLGDGSLVSVYQCGFSVHFPAS